MRAIVAMPASPSMGKLVVLVVLAFVAYALWRAMQSRALGARKGDRAPGAAPAAQSPDGESMVACARCGVHLPRGESLLTAGRYYCSPEHVEEKRP
jgi:uncharacterized protein